MKTAKQIIDDEAYWEVFAVLSFSPVRRGECLQRSSALERHIRAGGKVVARDKTIDCVEGETIAVHRYRLA